MQFDFTDDLMAYATYARGYKGPAYNVFFNMTRPNNAEVIDAETADSYELGLKSTLADGRLLLNGRGLFRQVRQLPGQQLPDPERRADHDADQRRQR